MLQMTPENPCQVVFWIFHNISLRKTDPLAVFTQAHGTKLRQLPKIYCNFSVNVIKEKVGNELELSRVYISIDQSHKIIISFYPARLVISSWQFLILEQTERET